MKKGSLPELKIKLGMDPIFRPVFNSIPVQVLRINTKIKLGPGFRSMDLIPLHPQIHNTFIPAKHQDHYGGTQVGLSYGASVNRIVDRPDIPGPKFLLVSNRRALSTQLLFGLSNSSLHVNQIITYKVYQNILLKICILYVLMCIRIREIFPCKQRYCSYAPACVAHHAYKRDGKVSL